MTRREDIIVSLGGDAAKLLKEFGVAKNAANAWARDVAKELTTGHLPASWKSYSRNTTEALKQTEGAAKQTGTTFKGVFGAMFGMASIGMVKKFATATINSFKEVAQELGALNKEWNAAPWLKQQREAQLRSMSGSDVENIVVGNAQWQSTMKMKDDYLAKAAGLYGFGIGTIKQKFFGEKDILGNRPTWGQAAANAANEQKEIMAGIRMAATTAEMEKQSKEAKTKSDELKKQTDEAKLENVLAQASLESQRMTLMNMRDHSKTLKEWYQWDTKIFEKEKEIADQKAAANKKEAAALEKIKKKADELAEKEATRLAKFDKVSLAFNHSLRDDFMPTLDELAEGSAYSRDARRLKFLGDDTKRALRWGFNDKYINKNLKEIQSIRDRLSKAGVYRDPNQGMIDELNILTAPVKDGKGLPVAVQLAD